MSEPLGSTRWVYLSPHLDDVAFSCAGLIWRQTRDDGNAAIWTVFTGSPPERVSDHAESFHSTWGIAGDPMLWRKNEDAESCAILGARYRHLDYPDAVYRRAEDTDEWMYSSHAAVSGRVHPFDAWLVQDLADRLRAELPDDATVVCPLALGRHVDHQITRLAAERLGRPLLYYADYPYVLQNLESLQFLQEQAWVKRPHDLSADAIRAWQDSVLAHRSQIGGFWPEGGNQVRCEIAEYAGRSRGGGLWFPPRGPAGNPPRSENCEEVRNLASEGRRRSASTSRTSGVADSASFAVCSRDGFSVRASRPGSVPRASRSEGKRVYEKGLSFCVISGGGRPEKLQRLVESISRQRVPASEVIVCGDAPPSSSYQYVEARDEAAMGAVSALRNRAAEHAKYDFIVFCDDDMVLNRSWWDGLRPYLESYDLLTTRILNPDGTRHWDWTALHAPGRQHLLPYGTHDTDLYLTGGLIVVRTDVWSCLPWDEKLFFCQAEDVAFSQRIIGTGHRFGICLESFATHDDHRHTQLGNGVSFRSDRGIARYRDRELHTMAAGSLAVSAVRELIDGEDANAADCIRAWLSKEPEHSIAQELLRFLYCRHGGSIDGNDDWQMPGDRVGRWIPQSLSRAPAQRARTVQTRVLSR